MQIASKNHQVQMHAKSQVNVHSAPAHKRKIRDGTEANGGENSGDEVEATYILGASILCVGD